MLTGGPLTWFCTSGLLVVSWSPSCAQRTVKRACLGIHHLIVVLWKVGNDHSEGMQHCHGAGRGEMQVCSHMVVQNVQGQLPPCPSNANLSAEVVNPLQSSNMSVGTDNINKIFIPHS